MKKVVGPYVPTTFFFYFKRVVEDVDPYTF